MYDFEPLVRLAIHLAPYAAVMVGGTAAWVKFTEWRNFRRYELNRLRYSRWRLYAIRNNRM